jgi:hypothetical protein
MKGSEESKKRSRLLTCLGKAAVQSGIGAKAEYSMSRRPRGLLKLCRAIEESNAEAGSSTSW